LGDVKATAKEEVRNNTEAVQAPKNTGSETIDWAPHEIKPEMDSIAFGNASAP
jgi:hypothetical protein